MKLCVTLPVKRSLGMQLYDVKCLRGYEPIPPINISGNCPIHVSYALSSLIHVCLQVLYVLQSAYFVVVLRCCFYVKFSEIKCCNGRAKFNLSLSISNWRK